MAKRDYTAEEIDLGLTYLVMAAGNGRAAARNLKADHGLTIPRETLRDWRLLTHDTAASRRVTAQLRQPGVFR